MTRDEAIAYEESLHRQYFEPFDQLLEKKAQYYLKKVDEGGKENPYLLREIEIMEKFREYVAILETMAQDHLDGQYKLARQVEWYKERWMTAEQFRTLWRELYECAMRNQIHLNLKIKRLQEQC